MSFAGKYLKIPAWARAVVPVLLLLPVWLAIRPAGFDDPYSTLVEDRDGRLLGAIIAGDGQWRFPPPDSLPERMKACIILFEDKNFLHHPGVDLSALGRALYLNLKYRKVVSGGSTISMQVIRLMRKSMPRTINEKVLEISLAIRLELMYSKEEILAIYLSHAPFGGNVVGLEAASWRYFGCPPAMLTWADAATLAVLPNAPALIHPGRNRVLLEQKRNALLGRLLAAGTIDTLTWSLSLAEPLPAEPLPLPQHAPHLLARIHGSRQGMRTRTTVDIHLQQAVQELLNRHVQRLRQNHVHNAAALLLEVESGQVLAWAGNTTLEGDLHGEMVDIVMAPRSSGSVLKPLLYAACLQDGVLLPATLVADVPSRMQGFTPKNFSDTYDGAVPAGRALSRSLNIPAVKMLQAYGVERFHSLLGDLGFSSIDRPAFHYGLSLILGGAEVTLWELAGVYAGMSRTLNHFYASSGQYFQEDLFPPGVLMDERRQGAGSGKTARRLEAAPVWLAYKAMEEVNRPEMREQPGLFSSSRRLAWKTGTSFGFRDAWALGTDPAYVVAVWAGNAGGEGRPGLTGLNAAAPLMFEIFDLLPAVDWFDQPFDEMARIACCSQSGYRAGPYCTLVDSTWVPQAGLRTEPCPYHRLLHLDRSRQYRLSGDCAEPAEMVQEAWFVLPPVMEWFYRANNPWYREVPPYRYDCRPEEQSGRMAFIYPDPHARIYVPVGLEGKREKAVMEVAHRDPDAIIYWHLDEDYIGQTQGRHQMGVSPGMGEHLLTVMDEKGEMASVRFTVVNTERERKK
jgi:penicillin-binding protein 1C